MSASSKQSFEKEFEDFFSLCRKQGFSHQDLQAICGPLLLKNYLRTAKKWALGLVGLSAALYAMFLWMEPLSWFLSAVGRLMLIKLLPYWDWVPLYNSKCLIERSTDTITKSPAPSLGKFETDPSNCVLCEIFNGIPTAMNVTFSQLEERFLERGVPVIVTDSHEPQTVPSFLQQMLVNTQDFLESEPCDVATNLMLRKIFRVDLAIEKIKSLPPADRWFLQLRNCQFKAVKSSRRFVTRPYYYPVHLEPFYSSWVLMANNYAELQKEIYLQGLIFVQQINGFFDLRLKPKRPCERICPVINIRLDAGECLVFSTDMWTLTYGSGSVDNKSTSIATVLEIDWRL